MTQTTIGLFLFDGAEELDFVGPFEVFTMVNEIAPYLKADLRHNVLLISRDGDDITGAKGMRIGIDCAMTEAPALDVFCIPGGAGTRHLITDQPVLDWIAHATQTCTWITSVCTGSLVLSAAGPARGKRVTTHWAVMDELRRLNPEGEIIEGQRYVQDGRVITAAGVSAGIDMALWLTGQIHSPDVARVVQNAVEDDPAPPYGPDDGVGSDPLSRHPRPPQGIGSGGRGHPPPRAERKSSKDSRMLPVSFQHLPKNPGRLALFSAPGGLSFF